MTHECSLSIILPHDPVMDVLRKLKHHTRVIMLSRNAQRHHGTKSCKNGLGLALPRLSPFSLTGRIRTHVPLRLFCFRIFCISRSRLKNLYNSEICFPPRTVGGIASLFGNRLLSSLACTLSKRTLPSGVSESLPLILSRHTFECGFEQSFISLCSR